MEYNGNSNDLSIKNNLYDRKYADDTDEIGKELRENKVEVMEYNGLSNDFIIPNNSTKKKYADNTDQIEYGTVVTENAADDTNEINKELTETDIEVLEHNGLSNDLSIQNNLQDGKYADNTDEIDKEITESDNDESRRNLIDRITIFSLLIGILNGLKNLMVKIYNLKIYICLLFILPSVILPSGNYWAWEYSGKIISLQNSICRKNYMENFTKVELEPWNEGNESSKTERDLNDMFVKQTYYTNRKKYSSLLQVFTESANEYAQRYLLVADQGFGKTTSMKMLYFEWCRCLRDESKFIRKIRYSMDAIFNQEFAEIGLYQKIIFKITMIYLNVLKTIVALINIILSLIPKKLIIYGYDIGFINGISLELPVSYLPKLLFAFEFRNIINIATLTKTILSQNLSQLQGIGEEDLNLMFKKEIHSILLVLDGWDEYSKLKYSVGAAPEMEAIVYREEKKNINLLVTTRSWKSDDLLLIDRFGFTKLSLTHFSVPVDRDLYIHNFFPVGDEANELIQVLNRNDHVVPEELQKQPRMLLYICNIWKYRKNLKNEELEDKNMFWDEIWEMMRLTFNRKYPHKTMSSNDVLLLRNKIGEFVTNFDENDAQSFDKFNKQFGDHFDLFYFGIFSTETYKEIPWRENPVSPGQKVKGQIVKATNPSMMKAEKELYAEKESSDKEQKVNESHGYVFIAILLLILLFFGKK